MRYLAVIAALVMFPAAVAYGGGTRTYTVAGDSMEPTLHAGDTVTVSDGLEGAPERGSLVAVMLGKRERPMVKRVAAIPGDKVEVLDGLLYVNGTKHEPEIRVDDRRWRSTLRQLENYGWVVPEGSVLLLGDNPLNSRDSARLGLIPVESITGNLTVNNDDAIQP